MNHFTKPPEQRHEFNIAKLCHFSNCIYTYKETSFINEIVRMTKLICIISKKLHGWFIYLYTSIAFTCFFSSMCRESSVHNMTSINANTFCHRICITPLLCAVIILRTFPSTSSDRKICTISLKVAKIGMKGCLNFECQPRLLMVQHHTV